MTARPKSTQTNNNGPAFRIIETPFSQVESKNRFAVGIGKGESMGKREKSFFEKYGDVLLLEAFGTHRVALYKNGYV